MEISPDSRQSRQVSTQVSQAYGRLPLRFEANRGQTDPQVSFLAHGHGFTLFLTGTEAVMQLKNEDGRLQIDSARLPAGMDSPQSAICHPPSAMFRMKLIGANDGRPVAGVDELPGRSSYFIGSDARRWRTGVPGFTRVRHENVWPGIDLEWHGRQREPEYDFRLAPGALPQQIRLMFEGAENLRVDETGALLMTVAGRTLRWLKPEAWQERNGQRQEVACAYSLQNNQIEFELGAYDPAAELIIDPVLSFSSFLGGAGTEQGLAVAVDRDGSAYIAGTTTSTDFPGSSPIQPGKGSGPTSDAFVLKLNPAGTRIVYATYLGGGGADLANALAVDAAGSVFLAGATASSDFPTTAGAYQRASGGLQDVFVAKLNPAGSALVYSTLIGGDYSDQAFGLAVDAEGNTYLTGQTDSTNYPTAGSVSARRGAALFSSSDSGSSWSVSNSGLTANSVRAVAVDPANTQNVYAIAATSLFKSANGGAGWQQVSTTPLVSGVPQGLLSLAIDPKSPATLYLGSAGTVYKSTNGGATLEARSAGLPQAAVVSLVIDPMTTTTIYAGTTSGVYKSANGGESWLPMNNGLSGTPGGGGTIPTVLQLAIDPAIPDTLYAATTRGLFRTTDGGAVWLVSSNGIGVSGAVFQASAVAVDPQTPTTVYAAAGASNGVVFKSLNGGATWQPSDTGLAVTLGGNNVRFVPTWLAINALAPTTLYAATSQGVFRSTDGGANWSLGNSGLTTRNVFALAVDPASATKVYAAANAGSDVFVTKLNAAGSALAYSMYIGGDDNDFGRSVALDHAGNALITGQTLSPGFPTVSPLQATFSGVGDAFIARVNATGSALSFATFLGGSFPDQGNGIALDEAGNVYVAGWTNSLNFPTVRPLYDRNAGIFDAFVTKLKADLSAVEYATYLGGGGSDQAFGLDVDSAGNAYITGATASFDFPAINSLQQFAGSDAFVAKLNPSGSKLLYSTFLGGFGADQGNAIAVDDAGNAYVTGATASSNFPTANPVQAFRGNDAFIVKLSPAIDLSLTIEDTPDPVAVGSNLTYTITVSNRGDNTATGVMVTQQLPSGATLVSARASQGTCSGAGPVTCNIGSLEAGATATMTIIVTPSQAQTLSSTASVTSNEADINPASNSATVTTQAQNADLSITVTPSHLRIGAGARLSWIVSVRNSGAVGVSGVTLTDNLPAQVTFETCRATDGGGCGGAGNNRTVSFPLIGAGQVVSALLTALVNDGVAPGTAITNSAGINSLPADPEPGNNQNSATTTVIQASASPRGNGNIALESQRLGPSSIYVVRPDGSGLFPFIELSGARYPAWSFDGSKIAATSDSELKIADADGSNLLKVSFPQGTNVFAPAWSPDALRLAFAWSANDPALSGIYVINADGTGQKRITPLLASGSLRWSPDGTRLLFENGGLRTCFIDGSGLTVITQPTGGRDAFPSWSPDGSKIIFTREVRDNSFSPPSIHLINADGSGVRRLTNNDQFEYYPVFSPDGTKIAFIRGARLYVMNADGTEDKEIVRSDSLDGLFGIDWQPQTAATPRTFIISGSILNTSNRFSQARLELSGSKTSTIFLTSSGPFSIGNLREGGSYTIRPSAPSFRFEPESRTYNNLTADQTGADFTGTLFTLRIGGRVTDFSGAGIAGVTVQLFGNVFPNPNTTETDAAGNYAFTGLLGGQDYTVKPTGVASNDLFDPASVRYTAIEGDKVANFTGFREKFTLSGKVTNGSGAGVSGATVTLNGGGGSLTATTSDTGEYSFAGVSGGFTYRVTATKAGVTIAPATRDVLLNRPREVNFFADVSQATPVSAASYNAQAIATGGIVALFGANLAVTTKEASGDFLPFELDGVSVHLTAGNAAERECQLFFISPNQINFLLPVPASPFNEIFGDGIITVKRDGQVRAVAPVRIDRVAPALFAADSTGSGPAAALALRVKADGSQVIEPVARYDTAQQKFVTVPIDLRNEAEQVFLILFGTGIRLRSDLSAVQVKLGGVDAPVTYAGAQPTFFGLDQVNVLIPRSLAGRGETDINLTVEGKAANPLRFNLK